jgi:predicted alpha/beta hydrolase
MSQQARPLYFPSGSRTLFGWLHAARGPLLSDMGVVLCKPFGYEALCAHDGLRAFASSCAAAGLNTLLFDYSGTGDSSDVIDTSDESDEILRWSEDICAAIDALEHTCGVRRICLMGVRLGALLGCLVAARRHIDCQIAVAPVTSGRRYVRELRAFQAGASAAARASTEVDDRACAGLEVAGFRLSDKAVATLKRIDLTKITAAPDTAVLILDRNDLPDASRLARTFEASGVEVTYTALPGFPEMVSTPETSVIPVMMIESSRNWLAARSMKHDAAVPGPATANIPTGARMLIRSESGVDLVERATFLDTERKLFAVVTELKTTVSSGRASRGVILLNCGGTSHIGPNRMSVDTARSWAAEGFVVLRLDLAGLGDSDGRAEEAREVYPPGALYDIGLAVEFLRRRRGVRDISMVGVCSGAYHALRSAIVGLPVNRVLLINPLTFYWRRGDSLGDLQISEVIRNPGTYLENSFSLPHWRKLLRGRVNLGRIVKVFVRRALLSIDSTRRDLCRTLGIRVINDLGWDLASVAERGVRMVFIFARGDTGLELLRNQGGSMVNKLGDKCRVHVVDGADHTFSRYAARMKLTKLLETELAG